jgi:hypothetical protein
VGEGRDDELIMENFVENRLRRAMGVKAPVIFRDDEH